jgi:hypothetical protein
VAGVRDGVPDNAPDTEVTEEMLGGNEVILDLGNGLFAIYAHLQPESIRVKEGDRVYAGDVLGSAAELGADVRRDSLRIVAGRNQIHARNQILPNPRFESRYR